MSGQAAGRATAGPPAPSAGRRLYRGVAFAVFVGVAGAALSAVPALFVQSIFVSELQRCDEAIRRVEAGGEAPLNCIDEFRDPPVWLPPSIVVGGLVIGALGGFGYGFAAPRGPKGREGPDAQWLPF